MKSFILSILGFLFFSQLLKAQELQAPPVVAKDSVEFNFFAGIGIAVISDYNINNKLAGAGMPQIGNELPEFTIGYNLSSSKFSIDFEFNANYYNKKHPDNRVQMAAAGFLIRPHYIVVKNKNILLSGGLDVSFVASNFELYRRGMVTDLNNLNPSDYNGRISLTNNLVYAGPSVKFMFLRNYHIPLAVTAGYDIAFTAGKWKSDFGSVANTVNESGHNRFYAKICYYL